MACDFSPNTPILNYNPDAHIRGRHRSLYLAWPVYAFRVVAPRAQELQLNVFQKAVLGLCQAGRTTADDIANRLHVHPDLANRVLQELANKAWIDRHTLITTAHGEERLAIERADVSAATSVIGWVFRDPGSGKLWPRFMEELRNADAEFDPGSKYPRVNIRSKGHPQYITPRMYFSGPSWIDATPIANEVLEAVAQQQRALKSLAQSDSERPDEDEFTGVWHNPVNMDKVSVITIQPQPCYVLTYLYVIEDDFWEDWYVCDPFLPGSHSVFLYKEIQRCLSFDSQLHDWVQKFLGQTRKPAADMQAARDLIDEEVKRKTRPDIPATPLFEVLVALERAYHGIKDDSPQDQLKDVLVKAGIVLERLFAYLQQHYPASGACDVFQTNDRSYRESLLNTLAGQWGFKTPIPKRLSGIHPGSVKAAAEGRGGTLGQRVVAALLVARLNEKHPLRQVASQAPDLLADLARVIELRNQGAHDDINQAYDKTKIQNQVELTYKIVNTLFEKI